MSLALFDEPPRVSINNPAVVGGSRNALLLGFDTDGDVMGLLCLEDGSVSLCHSSWFSLDYRYDAETDRWIDQNAVRPVQPDQEG